MCYHVYVMRHTKGFLAIRSKSRDRVLLVGFSLFLYHVYRLSALSRDGNVHVYRLSALSRDGNVHVYRLSVLSRDGNVHVYRLSALSRDSNMIPANRRLMYILKLIISNQYELRQRHG